MILLLNNKEQIIESISDSNIYTNDEHLRLTDENYVSYILEAEVKYLPKSTTDRTVYVMVGKESKYQSYYVSQIQTQNNRTFITGVSTIIEQLRKTVVPKVSGSMPLRDALYLAAEETDITVYMDDLTMERSAYVDLHYTNAWEIIKELSYYYGFEIDFDVRYTGENEQTDPYEKRLIIRDPVGLDRPGEAVVYGYNAKSFISEKDRTETITALYGFGKPINQTQKYRDWERATKERLRELHGRDWQSFVPEVGFDEDNPPRVDMSNVKSSLKPEGQMYLGLPEDSAEMMALGLWDRREKRFKHRFDTVIFNDLEDPLDVYTATKEELQRRMFETIYYKVVVDGLDVNIGDVVRIGSTLDTADDSDFNKARVIELTKDNKLDKNVNIRIGEHITKSRNRQRREQRDDLGYTPLTSNPSLNSFGTPQNRGPLSGIDDILDGSWTEWDDLDGFGDWEGDFGDHGLDKPDKPDVPDLPDWPDFSGVLDDNLVVAPNTMSETSIQNAGSFAIDRNAIDDWLELKSFYGDLEREGPAVSISNYSGLGYETRHHYRVDGSVGATSELTYIIGYPDQTIGEIVSETDLIFRGINTEGIDFNMTIEDIYDGNYEIPEDNIPYEFDDVNGLNILGENFIIIPAGGTLSPGAVTSIAVRSINFGKYTDESELTTATATWSDLRDVTNNSPNQVQVSAIRFTLFHRYDGEIGTTSVVVVNGMPHHLAAEGVREYMRGRQYLYERYPINEFFDLSLIPEGRTIAEIYNALSNPLDSDGSGGESSIGGGEDAGGGGEGGGIRD